MVIDPERFWKNVDIRGEDECWPWKLKLDQSEPNRPGYGRFYCQRDDSTTNYIYAHRVAFLLSGGKIAPGQLVCHSCDYKPCCNPKHLYAGGYDNNAQDREARSVYLKPRGRRKTGQILTCPVCRKEFYIPACMKGKRTTCSKECHVANRVGKPRPNIRTGQMLRCKTCHKEFWATRSQIEKRHKQFCSNACYRAGSRVTKTCVWCDRKYTVPLSQDWRRCFCSMKCVRNSNEARMAVRDSPSRPTPPRPA